MAYACIFTFKCHEIFINNTMLLVVALQIAAINGKIVRSGGTTKTQDTSYPVNFTCHNHPSVIIPWTSYCDGRPDCPDSSDESTVPFGFKCTFANSRCTIPQETLRHNRTICPDQSDSCFDSAGTLTCPLCLDNKTVISKGQICDGVVDCPDLSDECTCHDSPVKPLCDFILRSNATNCTECGRHGRCRDDLSFVCDGHVNCHDNVIDEKFCSTPPAAITHKCFGHATKEQLTSSSQLTGTLCDGVVECPELREDECGCPRFNGSCGADPKKTTCPISGADGELSDSDICDGVFDCDDGADEKDCDWRFRCFTGKWKRKWTHGTDVRAITSIALTRVCDGIDDCEDEHDEKHCKGTGVNRTINNAAVDNYTSIEAALESYECWSFSDVTFSSKSELIKNPYIRYFIYITACLSLIGNSRVVYITRRNLSRLRNKASFQYWNTFYIGVLAFSDCLMGCGLLLLSVKSIQFSGHYCEHDIEWRPSVLCNVIGFLKSFTYLLSVTVSVVLTSLRLKTVLHPLGPNEVNKRYFCYLPLGMSLLAAVICIVPIFHNKSPPDEVTIDKNLYFSGHHVHINEIKHYADITVQILQLDGTVVRETPLNYVQSSHFKSRFPHRYVHLAKYFGYYNHFGVCSTDIHTDDQLYQALNYSSFIYNVIAMLFMGTSYIVIYRKSTHNNSSSSDVRSKENETLRRRSTMLVLSNVVCWLPYTLTPVVRLLATDEVKEIFHSIASLVLLPLNSLMNPIIYARLHVSIINKLCCKPKKIK